MAKTIPAAVVVLDFDGTITRQEDGSLWQIVNNLLSEELKDEVQSIHKKYATLYESGVLSQKEEIEWTEQTIDVYARGRITMNDVKNALKTIPVRPGLNDCLRRLKSANIPVAVISYGIRDFIEIVLENNNTSKLFNAIYATALHIRDGKIKGIVDRRFIVPPTKKGLLSRHFANKHNVPYSRIIAITDSPGDPYIGHLFRNRLGITDKPENLEQLRQHPAFSMAIYLKEGHFANAERWIMEKIEKLKKEVR